MAKTLAGKMTKLSGKASTDAERQAARQSVVKDILKTTGKASTDAERKSLRGK